MLKAHFFHFVEGTFLLHIYSQNVDMMDLERRRNIMTSFANCCFKSNNPVLKKKRDFDYVCIVKLSALEKIKQDSFNAV